MVPADENKFYDNLPNESASPDSILNALFYQLQRFPPDYSEIRNQSDLLKNLLPSFTLPVENSSIDPLIPFIEKSKGDIASQLFSLLEALIPRLTNPENLISRQLIKVNPDLIIFFADKQNDERGFFSSKTALLKISQIVNHIIDNSVINYSEWQLENYLEMNLSIVMLNDLICLLSYTAADKHKEKQCL